MVKVPKPFDGTRREREAITPARLERFADDPRSFTATGQPAFREQHADPARVGSAIRSQTPRQPQVTQMATKPGSQNIWNNPWGAVAWLKGFTSE